MVCLSLTNFFCNTFSRQKLAQHIVSCLKSFESASYCKSHLFDIFFYSIEPFPDFGQLWVLHDVSLTCNEVQDVYLRESFT